MGILPGPRELSVIERLILYEFALWGRDLVTVVRIREIFFIKNIWAFCRNQGNYP